MMKQLPSLRTILILSFGLLTIILSSVSGLLVKQKLNTELERNVSENLTRISEEFTAQLKKSLSDRFLTLQSLSGTDEFKRGSISSAVLDNDLIKIKTVDPRFAWLGYATINGKLVASTLPALQNIDVKERSWFKSGRNGLYFGEMYESPTLKKYLAAPDEHFRLVDISVPVRDKNGIVIGVLCAQLSWNWAVDLESGFDYPYLKNNNIQMLVLNSKHMVVIGPENLIGKKLFNKTLAPLSLTDPKTGFAHDTIDGERHVIGYTAVENGLDWYVVAVRKEIEAYAPIEQANMEIAAVVAAAIVSMLVLASFAAYRLTRPMNLMIGDVQAVIKKVEDVSSDLNLQTDEVKVRGYRELATFSEEINKLLHAIASSDFKTKYLERVVTNSILSADEVKDHHDDHYEHH